jgi:LPXTG-motif cell wall-anchored protein
MPRLLSRVAGAAALMCLAGALASAQTTATSSETKNFEVIAVQGNNLVVQLPEGTRELTVPESFKFTVNGQPLSVHELKPGMTGTATITTTTKTTPVTVTEVKNGEVVMVSGSNLFVRTGGDVKMFTQSEIDKRGVSIMREGKPAKLAEFRAGDQLSATIITTKPPRVVTDKEVQAIVNQTAARTEAPAAPVPAESVAPSANAAPSGTSGRSLPKTAGTLPLSGVIGLTSLLLAAGLALRRRREEQ